METKGLQCVFHGRVRFVEFVVLFSPFHLNTREK